MYTTLFTVKCSIFFIVFIYYIIIFSGVEVFSVFWDTPGKTASVIENDMYNHLVFPVNLQQWFIRWWYEGLKKTDLLILHWRNRAVVEMTE